jgi:transposase
MRPSRTWPTWTAWVSRRTHDYVRHGTTSLFAAYDLASGSVIAQHYRLHRHQELLRFLKLIDAAVPKDMDLHLVLDNYAAHKTPAIHQWLIKRPRFHLHFTPTSSSWLNLAERWFAELTNRKLRRSAHRSVTELDADIPQVDQRVEQRPQAIHMDQIRRRET